VKSLSLKMVNRNQFSFVIKQSSLISKSLKLGDNPLKGGCNSDGYLNLDLLETTAKSMKILRKATNQGFYRDSRDLCLIKGIAVTVDSK
jgi:orotate phosphoribosyltransferase